MRIGGHADSAARKLLPLVRGRERIEAARKQIRLHGSKRTHKSELLHAFEASDRRSFAAAIGVALVR